MREKVNEEIKLVREAAEQGHLTWSYHNVLNLMMPYPKNVCYACATTLVTWTMKRRGGQGRVVTKCQGRMIQAQSASRTTQVQIQAQALLVWRAVMTGLRPQ